MSDRYREIVQIVADVIDFIDAENAYCYEIGDGKVNYVYRVEDIHGNSVIVKHADKVIRSTGSQLLSTHRSAIEHEQLRIIGQIVPNFVPEILHYDKERHIIIMEDLKEYELLSEALLNYKTFPNFAAQISRFLFDTLFRTTDIVIPSRQKKKGVHTLFNPEMCDITERLAFTEPYVGNGELRYEEENAEFVQKQIQENEALKFQVAFLKYRFKNLAQSMLHGDLHTGSIFINQDTLKVFDPEYAFYGPMGFDIGTLIGNLCIPWMVGYITAAEGKEAFTFWMEETIERILNRFFVEYDNNFDTLVTDPMMQREAYKAHMRKQIFADTCGYAGTEIIRATIGSDRSIGLKRNRPKEEQVLLERVLLVIGIQLILHRQEFEDAKHLIAQSRKWVDATLQKP